MPKTKENSKIFHLTILKMNYFCRESKDGAKIDLQGKRKDIPDWAASRSSSSSKIRLIPPESSRNFLCNSRMSPKAKKLWDTTDARNLNAWASSPIKITLVWGTTKRQEKGGEEERGGWGVRQRKERSFFVNFTLRCCRGPVSLVLHSI